MALAPHTHWKRVQSYKSTAGKNPGPPQEQASTTKKLRFIGAKLATDVIGGEWEPALEPRHIRLRHWRHIQAFVFSFFECSLFRGLSKEADAPSQCTADVESLV